MPEYPEWLVARVADRVSPVLGEMRPGLKQMLSFEVAEKILDELMFYPTYPGSTLWESHAYPQQRYEGRQR